MALQEDLRTQGDFLFRYRSYLPLGLVVVGLCVKVYQERFNGPASEGLISESLEAIALAVGLIGLAVRVVTIGFAPKDTSGRNTGAGQVAAVLNRTGAYSVCRNPLYVGNYLMWLAITLIAGNIWFVALFSLAFWIYYERIIYAEERFLRVKFGNAYLQWAETTPMFFPDLSRYEAPATRFDWRKVLRQEKNGFFALMLLICVFSLAGDAAEGQLSVAEECATVSAALFAALAYVLLKFLKARTTILDTA
ncbi:MAG: isoprenylcysteine carboxylmethyltransferase family protein [Pseudomonadota bacterium]